jgi:hypothetical protein
MPDLPTESVVYTKFVMLLLGFITLSFDPPRFTVRVPFLADALSLFLSGEEIANSPPLTTDMS